MNKTFKVVSVVGPTASGKTRLSVELAKIFDGEIISADSMQIYKGMDIATAKPDEQEKSGITHHLMDFLPITESYSVAQFTSDASRCIREISDRGKLPFIVGGTGLYVDSLLNNIQFSAESRDDAVTEELRQIYLSDGVEGILNILKDVDFEAYEKLRVQKNPKRIIRAIEFYKTTGKTISQQIQDSRRLPSPYQSVKLGINFNNREVLYSRINKRVDIMLEKGLVDEAKLFLEKNLGKTASKAIGYKELEPYINGDLPLEDCIEKLKRETRRYAKRQITWFKRDKDINWIYPDECSSFEELLDKSVNIINEGLNYG